MALTHYQKKIIVGPVNSPDPQQKNTQTNKKHCLSDSAFKPPHNGALDIDNSTNKRYQAKQRNE